MRAVIQRVSRARVSVIADAADAATMAAAQATTDRAAPNLPGETVGQIGPGLLVYAAAAPDDGDEDVRYIAEKIVGLRIFRDADDKMNLSVRDPAGGLSPRHSTEQPAASEPARDGVLLISAFTVLADARKGRRPSFDGSASGPAAEPLIEQLAAAIRGLGVHVETGRFGAHMLVEAVNDGPICILLDSRRVV